MKESTKPKRIPRLRAWTNQKKVRALHTKSAPFTECRSAAFTERAPFTESLSVRLVLVKPLLCVVVFIAFLALPLAAFDYRFSLEPFMAARNGVVHEYVFVPTPGNDEYKLSQLDWNLKPVWLFGGKFKSSFDAFNVSGKVIGGWNDKTGVMRDWDYEEYDGKVTKMSEHTLTLRRLMETSGALSYSFDVGDRLILEPFAGFTYSVVSWDATNGYRQYAVETGDVYWNENLPKIMMSGKAVSYAHRMWYPSAGVNIDLDVFSYKNLFSIGIESSFSGAPYVWAEAIDNHWLTKTDYKDVMRRGYGIFGDFSINVSFYKYHTISLFANAALVQGLRGDALSRNTETNSGYGYLDAISGSDAQNYTFGISYKITIQ